MINQNWDWNITPYLQWTKKQEINLLWFCWIQILISNCSIAHAHKISVKLNCSKSFYHFHFLGGRAPRTTHLFSFQAFPPKKKKELRTTSLHIYVQENFSCLQLIETSKQHRSWSALLELDAFSKGQSPKKRDWRRGAIAASIYVKGLRVAIGFWIWRHLNSNLRDSRVEWTSFGSLPERTLEATFICPCATDRRGSCEWPLRTTSERPA